MEDLHYRHQLFLKWLLLTVLVVFGVLAGLYFDLIQHIIANDISLISLGIMGIFLVVFSYLSIRTSKISKQLNLAYEVRDIIRKCGFKNLKYEINDNNRVVVSNQILPDSLLTNYIANLIRKATASQSIHINQRMLIENFNDSLHEKNSIGWMTANKLISLGLLGTAIGFAVALTALFGIEAFDFIALKTTLSAVAVGMSVALFTTITAIIASVPLEIISYMIERGNNKLTSIATKVTEIYVIPVLERENAKNNINTNSS